MATGSRDTRARIGFRESSVPRTATEMWRSWRNGGMIVDAELFWIVIATTGNKSFKVFSFMVKQIYLRQMNKIYLFLILQKSRRRNRRENNSTDRHLLRLQVMKRLKERILWISNAHGCLCRDTDSG